MVLSYEEKLFKVPQTGSQYERSFLGELQRDEEYTEELEKVRQESKKKGLKYFVNFKDAMSLVKRFQPRDMEDPERKRIEPSDPQSPLLRDLRLELMERLDIENDEIIKAYTAVGSELDYIHGVDAFLEIAGEIVTLDLTLKSDISLKTKADIIINKEIQDPKDPDKEDEYLENVADIATRIYKKLSAETKEKLHDIALKKK